MGDLFHGINFDENTSVKDAARTAQEINDAILYISSEKHIKATIDKKAEAFGAARIASDTFLICHVFNQKISFAKVVGRKIVDFTKSDIALLVSPTKIKELSREFNKTVYLSSIDQRNGCEFISKELIYQIQIRDVMKSNKMVSADLSFINYDADECIVKHIETADMLNKELQKGKNEY